LDGERRGFISPVQQEYLPLVQFDYRTFIFLKLSQSPEGVGSGPNDPKELPHRYVNPGLTVLKGQYAVSGNQFLTHPSGSEVRRLVSVLPGTVGIHPVDYLFRYDSSLG
jgi:hypothetical protein